MRVVCDELWGVGRCRYGPDKLEEGGRDNVFPRENVAYVCRGLLRRNECVAEQSIAHICRLRLVLVCCKRRT